MSTLTLRNTTKSSETGVDSLKFCIYSKNDAVDWIPVEGGVGTIKNGDTQKWTKSAGDKNPEYYVAWFEASLIDGKLAGGTAPEGESNEIYHDGQGYHTKSI